MKKFRYLLFLFVVMGAITACVEKSQGANSIVNSSCNIPCWQNITPGVTKAEKLDLWLHAIPDMDGNKITRLPSWNKYDEIYMFSFQDKKSDGAIYIVEDRVESIVIYGDLGIPLEQVIKLYGEPEKIIISSAVIPVLFGSGIVLEVYLVYPQSGSAFSFYNSNLDLITIEPNVLIRKVVFSESNNIVNIVSPKEQALEVL